MSNKKLLELSEEKARELYKTASPEFKVMLEESFGKDFFKEKITDIVTSSFAALSIFTKKHPGLVYFQLYVYPDLKEKVAAYQQALVITEVLNEGWVPDWKNITKLKYYIYYNHSDGIFRISNITRCQSMDIYFKTGELAQHFINTFPEICNILYK